LRTAFAARDLPTTEDARGSARGHERPKTSSIRDAHVEVLAEARRSEEKRGSGLRLAGDARGPDGGVQGETSRHLVKKVDRKKEKCSPGAGKRILLGSGSRGGETSSHDLQRGSRVQAAGEGASRIRPFQRARRRRREQARKGSPANDERSK